MTALAIAATTATTLTETKSQRPCLTDWCLCGCSRLLSIEVEPDGTYINSYYAFASTFVRDTVMQQLIRTRKDDVRMWCMVATLPETGRCGAANVPAAAASQGYWHDTATTTAIAAALRGIFFEQLGHDVLQAGGRFEARKLQRRGKSEGGAPACHSCSWCCGGRQIWVIKHTWLVGLADGKEIIHFKRDAKLRYYKKLVRCRGTLTCVCTLMCRSKQHVADQPSRRYQHIGTGRVLLSMTHTALPSPLSVLRPHPATCNSK
jgi:hypothetical protein